MGTCSPTDSRRCPDATSCYCWQRWASLHYCSSGRTWWTPTSIWLWFGEVGFRGVWVTVLLTRVVIFIAVALVVGGTVFLGTIYLSHRR
jgi:hypothetical protein